MEAEYGWDAADVKILKTVSNEDLNSSEVECIAEHNTLWPNGLNMCNGGDAPDGEYVRESWKDAEIRQRHHEGRKRAWADEQKRANIVNGRKDSVKFKEAAKRTNNDPKVLAKRSATWESKREERLKGLVGKEREQKLAEMNKWREKARVRAAKKRLTSSQSHPSAACKTEDETQAMSKASGKRPLAPVSMPPMGEALVSDSDSESEQGALTSPRSPRSEQEEESDGGVEILFGPTVW